MNTYLVYSDDRQTPEFFNNLAKAKAYAKGLAQSRNLNVRVWKENLRTGIMQWAATVGPAYLRKQHNPAGSGWVKASHVRMLRNGRGQVTGVQVRGMKGGRNPGQGSGSRSRPIFSVVAAGVGQVYRGASIQDANRVALRYVQAGKTVDFYKDVGHGDDYFVPYWLQQRGR
jgi:hypothetical protein